MRLEREREREERQIGSSWRVAVARHHPHPTPRAAALAFITPPPHRARLGERAGRRRSSSVHTGAASGADLSALGFVQVHGKYLILFVSSPPPQVASALFVTGGGGRGRLDLSRGFAGSIIVLRFFFLLFFGGILAAGFDPFYWCVMRDECCCGYSSTDW